MAKETTPAAGANAGPEIDYDKLAEAMAKASAAIVASAVAEATKPLNDRLEKLAATQTASAAAAEESPKPGDKAKPLTLEDINKLLDTRDKQHQTASQQAEARKAVIADKLKDLPEVYRSQLGNDPTQWAAQEQAIRNQFKADFKGLGGKVEPVGGDNPGGKSPAQAVDISKLKPMQKLVMGITQETAAKGTASTQANA